MQAQAAVWVVPHVLMVAPEILLMLLDIIYLDFALAEAAAHLAGLVMVAILVAMAQIG